MTSTKTPAPHEREKHAPHDRDSHEPLDAVSPDDQGKKTETTGGRAFPKWMLAILAAFFVVYAVTVLATGEPTFLIPVLILAVLVFAYVGVNRLLTRRIVKRDGSMESAMSDADDPIPSAHLVPDSETPLGDTPEAHDEISPHDLPIGHPGRQEAEAQAGGKKGTTQGHTDPTDAPPDGARS